MFGFFKKNNSQENLTKIVEAANNITEMCYTKLIHIILELSLDKRDTKEFKDDIENIYKGFTHLIRDLVFVIVNSDCSDEDTEDNLLLAAAKIYFLMFKIEKITKINCKKIINTYLKHLIDIDKDIAEDKKALTTNKMYDTLDILEKISHKITKTDNDQTHESFKAFIDIVINKIHLYNKGDK